MTIIAETHRDARADALEHFDFWNLKQAGKYSLARHLAERAHELQYRATGDLYVTHVYGVAKILVDAGLERDLITRVCALLHDTIEDCAPDDKPRLRRVIRGRIGLVPYMIVETLTKKDGIDYPTQMVISIRRYHQIGLWRVPLIKLADILFNLSTIEGFNDLTKELHQFDKARRILDEVIVPSRKYIPRVYLAAYDHLLQSVETLLELKRQESIDRNRLQELQLHLAY